MKIGLIADIHSNVVALEAALRAMQRHRVEKIISLGDQVNLGPCPLETLDLLKAHDVLCLGGNHERYILSAMAHDPAYDGANFTSLRFNAALLTADQIRLPASMDLYGITLCHSMPGDDRFPINEPDEALPRLRAMHVEKPMRIICGHGHNPTHYRIGNLQIDSIGSVGCMDEGVPGVASYTLLYIDEDQVTIKPMITPYDPSPLFGLFKRGGMAEYCPIMARLAYWQMTLNADFLMRFVKRAFALAAAQGEKIISTDVWQATDAQFTWPDGMTTRAFWGIV